MNVITARESLGLVCHPRTPCTAVTAIQTAVAVTAGGRLSLGFVLQGDLSAVRLPAPRPSGRAQGLWRHTCFEAFLMGDTGPAYREFNFSPAGEWAVYAFRGYRDGGAPIGEAAPVIDVRRGEDRLSLDVEVCPEWLPTGRSLRLGLSAVVEGRDGGLSYWALRHPANRPDFHHADAFALALEPQAMPEAPVDTAGASP